MPHRDCGTPPLLINFLQLIKSNMCIDSMFAIRFTNNILSTAQQVWLRKLGGAKPVVNQGGSGIITAGRAKRTSAQPAQPGERCF